MMWERVKSDTPAEDDPVRQELARLRAENLHLDNQLKRLVQIEKDLYAFQGQLDAQVRLYHKLNQFGQRFAPNLELPQVLARITEFVLYELELQRCLILLFWPETHRFQLQAHDGYYDASDTPADLALLELSPDEPALAPLFGGIEYCLCTAESIDEELVPLRAMLGMDEFILFALQGSLDYPLGLLIAGNTLGMLDFQARLEPDNLTVIGLSNVVNQATTWISNITFYQALEQERRNLETIVAERTAELRSEIAEREHTEARRVALQQQLIETQQNVIRELSTPLIPLGDRVLLLPIIGTIDERRTRQILEVLLEGVALYGAHIVILDITGVKTVDVQVADGFVQAARAVRLLGAQVVLTGVQPHVAQAFVHLGIDLRTITTYSTLQAGIGFALQHRPLAR